MTNIIWRRKTDLNSIRKKLAELALTVEGVATAYSAESLINADYNEGGIKGSLARGYNQKRSGDVIITLLPGWLSGSGPAGTSHGSGYNYDTHVPIIFYGWGIKAGNTVKRYTVTDIVPTISMLLNIGLPNSSTGQPIEEIFK